MANDETMAEDCIRILRDALFTHEKELFYENRKKELGHGWVTRRRRCAVPIPRYTTLTQAAVDIVVLKLVHAGWISEWIDVNDRSSHNQPGFLCWLDERRAYYLVDPVENYEHTGIAYLNVVASGGLESLLEQPPANRMKMSEHRLYTPVICLTHNLDKPLYRWDADSALWHMVIPSVRLTP